MTLRLLTTEAQFLPGLDAVVVFTGSRTWMDHWTLKNVIDDLVVRAVTADVPTLTFRHGACYPPPDQDTGTRPPESADYLVHLWYLRFAAEQPIPIIEQQRPADWTGPCRPTCNQRKGRNQRANHRILRAGRWICPAAGNYRNTEMILEQPAPQFTVAFHQDGSNGTAHCIRTSRELSVPAHPISPEVTHARPR